MKIKILERIKFKYYLVVIVTLALVLRLTAIWNNNFYFTMDQGEEALSARQILHGQLAIKGTPTAVKGFYAGLLWRYFLALSFLLSSGHPVGGVIFLILINISLIAFLMKVIEKKIDLITSLLIGFCLIFFQPFFHTSWYYFNPHLLPLIATGTIICLSLVKKDCQKWLYLAAGLVGFTFHSEPAFFAPLLILFLLASGTLIILKTIKLKLFLQSLLTMSLFFLPRFLTELFGNFEQARAVLLEFSSKSGVFYKINFLVQLTKVIKEIFPLVAVSTIGISKSWLGIIFLASSLIFLNRRAGKKHFDFRFKVVLLTLILLLLSIFWFSLSRGMMSWHLVGLPVVIFISFIFSLSWLPKKIFYFLTIIILILQLNLFFNYSNQYFQASADESILANELKAIDWIYEQAEHQSFRVYSFLPSVYDFTYQYLFPWYGKKHYGFLPCEYSTYPKVSALSYVPDAGKFQLKEENCEQKSFFLIINPPVIQPILDQWYQGVTAGSSLLNQTTIGRIKIEKRLN